MKPLATVHEQNPFLDQQLAKLFALRANSCSPQALHFILTFVSVLPRSFSERVHLPFVSLVAPLSSIDLP